MVNASITSGTPPLSVKEGFAYSTSGSSTTAKMECVFSNS